MTIASLDTTCPGECDRIETGSEGVLPSDVRDPRRRPIEVETNQPPYPMCVFPAPPELNYGEVPFIDVTTRS